MTILLAMASGTLTSGLAFPIGNKLIDKIMSSDHGEVEREIHDIAVEQPQLRHNGCEIYRLKLTGTIIKKS